MLWASAEANGATAASTMPIGTSRQRQARYSAASDLLDRALRAPPARSRRPPLPLAAGGSRACGSDDHCVETMTQRGRAAASCARSVRAFVWFRAGGRAPRGRPSRGGRCAPAGSGRPESTVGARGWLRGPGARCLGGGGAGLVGRPAGGRAARGLHPVAGFGALDDRRRAHHLPRQPGRGHGVCGRRHDDRAGGGALGGAGRRWCRGGGRRRRRPRPARCSVPAHATSATPWPPATSRAAPAAARPGRPRSLAGWTRRASAGRSWSRSRRTASTRSSRPPSGRWWPAAPGVAAHRAVNTLDAMVGHRSPRYQRFGWASARLDDAAAWVPARLAALAVAVVRPTSGRRRLAGGPPPGAGPPVTERRRRGGCVRGGPRRHARRPQPLRRAGRGPAAAGGGASGRPRDVERAVVLLDARDGGDRAGERAAGRGSLRQRPRSCRGGRRRRRSAGHPPASRLTRWWPGRAGTR